MLKIPGAIPVTCTNKAPLIFITADIQNSDTEGNSMNNVPVVLDL